MTRLIKSYVFTQSTRTQAHTDQYNNCMRSGIRANRNESKSLVAVNRKTTKIMISQKDPDHRETLHTFRFVIGDTQIG